jgi:hypothetical protein
MSHSGFHRHRLDILPGVTDGSHTIVGLEHRSIASLCHHDGEAGCSLPIGLNEIYQLDVWIVFMHHSNSHIIWI